MEGARVERTWPLVGRAAELAYAQEVVAAGGAVVISGDAGVGKSRLLASLADQARADGRVVERATATSAAKGIPFGALAHLVPAGSLDPQFDRLLPAIVEALNARTDGQPRFVCVDDAHLLDDASATLVHLLAQQPGLALAVAVRVGEPCPDPVIALWKDGAATRLDLQPLSEHEVGLLAVEVLGGPIDPATLRMLFSSTNGNVLFLRELIRAGLDQGSLIETDGTWRWRGRATLGTTLQDLVTARLGILDDAERSGLEVVALGEPLPVTVLLELLEAEVVDHLEAKGVIEIADVGDRRVARVGHPLFGEATRAALPRRRSDELRERIADGLQNSGSPLGPDDLLRAASLRLDAGAPTDPAVLVAAARRAWSLADAELTERLANAALAEGPNVEARYLLGEVDVYRGDYEQAVDGWRGLLAGDLPDPLRGRIAKAAASVLGFTRNRAAEAEELLADAESRISSPDIRQRLASVRVSLFVHRMPRHEVQRITAPLLQGPDVSDEAKVWAWAASARDRLVGGRLASVIAESEHIEANARRARADWPLASLFVSMCRFYGLLLSARLDEAERMAARHLDSSLTDHISMPRSVWTAALGLVSLSRGHLDAAAEHHLAAARLLRRDDNGILQPVLIELAMIYGLQGETKRGEARLEEAEASHEGMIAPLIPLARSQATVLAAQGSTTAARKLLADLAASSRVAEQPLFELGALHDLVRYGAPIDAADRLVALSETFEGPVPHAYAHQAVALAAGDGDLLMAAAERFDTMGFDFDAAETYTAAASVLLPAGHKAGATAASRYAAERRLRCGTARSPLLALASVEVASLSDREREVASLAASGRTDAEIAEQLFVSVRTVNAHLRSVYTKIGVNSRSDLPEVLGTS